MRSTDKKSVNTTFLPFITDTSDLEPLTPPDTDIRAVAWFKLDMLKLGHSEFLHLATNEELGAAVKLWVFAFHQIPAGSLPNNEVVLAQAAGYDHRKKAWQRVRDMALYGWTLCSDGRLYHQETARMVFAFLVEEDTRKWAEEERNTALTRRSRKKSHDERTAEALTQNGGGHYAIH